MSCTRLCKVLLLFLFLADFVILIAGQSRFSQTIAIKDDEELQNNNPVQDSPLIIPTDGMVIKSDTVFQPGTYILPNGISIAASSVTLDMNGVIISRGNQPQPEFYGVSIIGPYEHITIKNCGAIQNYFYGLRIEDVTYLMIQNCNASNNWVDPASLSQNPPVLNINVGPDLNDTTNLGGGLFMQNVRLATVNNCTFSNQENGLDLFDVSQSTITNTSATQNTGWGIHLHNSPYNMILSNVFNFNTRSNVGNSASILLNNASSYNQVIKNKCMFSGNGVLIGNEYSSPSNFNFINSNDCSFCGATFASWNLLVSNTASSSQMGFLLSYSHSNNTVAQNTILQNNQHGILIEHGQENEIIKNTIERNGLNGILLETDGSNPYANYPWLNLPNPESSSDYIISLNTFSGNGEADLKLVNTTKSIIVNNRFRCSVNQSCNTAESDVLSAGNAWFRAPILEQNIVGGPYIGGNYWWDYSGKDLNGDGLGDTNLPYNNNRKIQGSVGDYHPELISIKPL